MFQNIVVAFITPSHKKKTFNHALELAKRFDSTLHILRCVEKPPLKYGFFTSKADKQILKNQNTKVENSLKTMEDAAKFFNIKTKSKITITDSVTDCILSYVLDNKPDLLILDAPLKVKHEESYYLGILEAISKSIHCPLLTIT